jgi:hypothetical protein
MVSIRPFRLLLSSRCHQPHSLVLFLLSCHTSGDELYLSQPLQMKASVIRCGLIVIFTETLMQNDFKITCVDITPARSLCLPARIHARRIERRIDSERLNP